MKDTLDCDFETKYTLASGHEFNYKLTGCTFSTNEKKVCIEMVTR